MDVVHDPSDRHRSAVHAQRGTDGGTAGKVVLGVRPTHEHCGTGLGPLVEPASFDEVCAPRAQVSWAHLPRLRDLGHRLGSLLFAHVGVGLALRNDIRRDKDEGR